MENCLYSIGEEIPLNIIPKQMYAYTIRPDFHGEPITAFKEEIIDVPELNSNEVLIQIKAVGINYNGVWAALGKPKSPMQMHGKKFHIAGSDASGIVHKIGSSVDKNSLSYKEGDHVIIHCGQYCGNCPECRGGDPMLCPSQKIWGYETPFGSFAQFSSVKPYQVLLKPSHLSWGEASSYMLTLATVWRMLYGHPPHTLKPSQNILILGGAGGIGTMAIQIVKNANANAIVVVSSKERGEYCLKLGAKAYINRKEFDCWGKIDKVGTKEYTDYLLKVRKLRKKIWEVTGKNRDPDIVIEHSGEETFPVSCYIVKKGGMVIYCGATSGFNLTLDAAYGWMHQKRVQGSHFASTLEAFAANEEVKQKKINPVLENIYKWNQLPYVHQLMHTNTHPPGNMAVILEN